MNLAVCLTGRPPSAGAGAAVYRDVKGRFLASMAGADGAAWERWVGASEEALLPEDSFVAAPPKVVRTEATLRAALGRSGREAGTSLPVEAARTLWEFAATLDERERVAFDCLVRRVVDPFEALATWPPGVLFDEAEVERLESVPRPRHRVRLPAVAPPSPGDADYAGTITAIVKVTRLCNLRCVYCNDWRAEKGQVMPFPVQLRVAEQLLTPEEHASVSFIWHGGEPTLLGRRAFLRLLMLQRWFQRPGQAIANHLQTNATNLDDGWADLLARYGFSVGISIDGPAEIHDRTRPHVSGRPTFEKVRRGLHTLRARGLPFGVHVVLGEAALALGADGVAEFLEAEDIPKVALLPVRPPAGRRRLGASFFSAETYADFLLAFERRRRRRGAGGPVVRELETLRRRVEKGEGTLCEMKGNCVGAFFSIDPDGTVAHCDKYVGDPEYVLGSIVTSSFAELRAADRVRLLAEEAKQAQDAYRSCPHFEVCRGWCPHESYMAKRYAGSQDPGCCGLRRVIAELGAPAGEAAGEAGAEVFDA